jgi:thymidine kinase
LPYIIQTFLNPKYKGAKEQMVIKSYVGKNASGKTYCMLRDLDKDKSNGKRIALMSFADPIKRFAREVLGLEKSGPIELFNPNLSDKEDLSAEISNAVQEWLIDQLVFIHGMDDYSYLSLMTLQRNFNNAWSKYGDELVNHYINCAAKYEYSIHFRRILQLLGTEFGRAVHDKIWILSWVKTMDNMIKTDTDIECIYLDDCRFRNEYQFMTELGELNTPQIQFECYGVIAPLDVRALRKNCSIDEILQADQHQSEQEVDHILTLLPPEMIIDNS